MYKTLQLFAKTFTFNTNKYTIIEVIKTHMHRHKVIKNAKCIKTWIKLKLFIIVTLQVIFVESKTLYNTSNN